MKLICKFCGTSYDETLTNCPNCGAPNENVKKTAESGPRTMDELKDWFYNKHGLTSAKTHIFVGENTNERAVFGMYKDKNTGDFVVYKNKANGERAIRYQGVDEQYAVNELYQLIQRQALRNGVDLNGSLNPGKITNRNSAVNNATRTTTNYTSSLNKGLGCGGVIFGLLLFLTVASSFISFWNSDSSALKKLYKQYQNKEISATEYYQTLDDMNYIEYRDGKYVKEGGSINKGSIFNVDRDIFKYGTNERFTDVDVLNSWMNSFPSHITTTYNSSDDYWYKDTNFIIERRTPGGNDFYIKPVTEEYHYYNPPTTYSNSGSSWDDDDDDWSSGGSSWDSDNSWDSGDWDSNWGYKGFSDIHRHLC